MIFNYLQIFDMGLLLSPGYRHNSELFRKVDNYLKEVIDTGNADLSIFNAMRVCSLWRALILDIMLDARYPKQSADQHSRAVGRVAKVKRLIKGMKTWRGMDKIEATSSSDISS